MLINSLGRSWFVLIVCLFLSLFTISCGRGYTNTSNRNAPCTGYDCEEGQASAGCTSDLQCPANAYCIGGICQESSPPQNSGPCQVHNDCEAGQFCDLVLRECVHCLTDDHCPLGQVCQSDGTCGSSLGCTLDSDCNPDLVCESASGECVSCIQNHHCDNGQTCRDNTCVFENTNSIPCGTQSECEPYGRICDFTSSTCLPCISDAQCGTGRVCNAGVCTNDSTTSTNPGSGSGCTSRADCGGQACFLGECTACFADAMCSDLNDVLSGTSIICNFDSGMCVEAECSTPADCAAPLGCWEGHCTTCQADSECRAGEACNSAGQCVPAGSLCAGNWQCSDGHVCVASNCQTCTNSNQCDAGQTCSAGACIPSPPTVGPEIGEPCSSTAQCSTGLTCIGLGSTQLCSRSCIGSGQGNGVDCPSGFACYKFSTDTFSLCLPNSVMLDAEGQPLQGSPYNQQPGASCATENGCQTLHCDTTTNQCLRKCTANRDCNSGEVCFTAWVPKEAPATGNEIMDVHYCIGSDTVNYQAVGNACTTGYECNTGLCEGTCSNNASQLCNNADDCGGAACNGSCAKHCRSTADCASNQTCGAWPTTAAAGSYSGWTSICQAKTGNGTTANGGSCSASAECTSDWCVAGICSTPCANYSDCTGGLSGRACGITSVGDGTGTHTYSTQFCR